ncbi:Ger(x)C family spore germination protein [Bacillus massiliigorillae]|uniref:Ger(x)C family spore germination protein n=1 Tax=Bacillus massiliigorillae TaxID=1243664 RepID=UPI0003A60976|nr:Ger(x)C family spore germination protein [Bacillus massiliigorillae]
MKIIKIGSLLCFILLACSGCWDQRLLKDKGVITIISFDLVKKELLETVAFPISIKGQDTSQEQEAVTVSGKGASTQDATEQINKKFAEELDYSKVQVFLIGEKLAKQSILPVMDTFYRDSKSPLNAYVAIVKGTAKEALSIVPPEQPLKGAYFNGLIKSAIKLGELPEVTVQDTSSKLEAAEKDILIPHIKLTDEQNRATVIGLALFNQNRFVGELSNLEAKMYLLLNGENRKKRTFTFKVSNKKKNELSNQVTFNVLKMKRNLVVKEKSDNIVVNIDLDLKLSIKEYPIDHLNREDVIRELNKNIQKELTKAANKTIKKLQQSNCDGLGIGLRVKAFHNDIWTKINWKETYQNIPITTNITTTIIDYGTTE